jgi:hypothetical protein
LSRLGFGRFSDQDDLAEDEGVDDREALLPKADPVPLQQLSVQAEKRKKEPQICADDGVSLELADSAFRQALFAAGVGRSRGLIR